MNGVLVFQIILGVSCAYALWRGGGPERVTSLMLFGAALLSVGASYQEVEIGILIVDHLLLLGLLLVLLYANRLWPIFMFGMHLLNVSSHWVRIEDPGIVATIYAIISQGWAYPMQMLLVAATLMHQRRLLRHGVDNSWLKSSSRLSRNTRRSQTD